MGEQALDPGWWAQMAAIFGPGGVVLLITNATSWYGLWLMWKRLQEKDAECRSEIDSQRQAWKSVVDGKDKDNKELAETVENLLVQVTRLVERASPRAR